ncbi:sialate O-acetylesterase [Desertivirga arenae]|uniref:sialate O-acetylesterase n=1 Tax=Desertivirga arenae TaxID=2810309 RepID=UPI001A95D7C0|nr:sialate O-acetylesterase [Pedobacter sp. SYSU D00823]
MLKKFKILLLLILIAVGGEVFAQEETSTIRNLQLYILAGQSNMAGRGQLTQELGKLSHSRVYMLDKDYRWQLAKNPVHFDKPGITGVGPGLSFGIEMAKEDSSIRIGLIPCAVGGTSIERWGIGAYDPVTKTHPFDDAVIRIQEAMKVGKIKGMLWLQGESNATTEASKSYMKNLEDLFNRIRKLSKNKDLPIVIGELGRFREPFQKFNQEVLAHVEKEIHNTGLITSEGLTHKGDSTHFDGQSAYQLGFRFAQKMKELQTERKK